jgi:hypothetical protein
MMQLWRRKLNRLKKLLYILLFVPLFALSQTVDDFSFVPITTDNNMAVVFPAGTLNDFVGGELIAFKSNGSPVSTACTIADDGSAGVAVIGTDALCGCSYMDYVYGNWDEGETIEFAILMNGDIIVNVDVNPSITYVPNSFEMVNADLIFTIEGNPVEFGCTDYNYLEYSFTANIDDGSCQEIRVDGCTDGNSCVYNPDANFDDGSCIYETPESMFNSCCLDNFVTSICPVDCDSDLDCINPGCMSEWADNYDIFATQDDGSCYKMGCTSEWADNYDAIATTDDGSCDRLGCVSDWADNYDALATTDDGSCYRIGCVSDWADNFDEYATIDDESCYRYGCTSNLAVNYDEYATIDNDNCDFDIITHLNMSFDAWNISFDLNAGWNMFGYGCPNPIDVAEGLSNHTESILITKDNNGSVYMPEFGFNGIGDFTPGYGYQIKVTEAIEGFSLCDWYVNDIPEDNIVSLQEENSSLQAELDCYENPQVGDYCFGGIVFYVDESDEHGLVAAQTDLEGTFEWGCYGVYLVGADGTSIGTGYANTMDIVNEGCLTENGGITAAQASIDFENEGYSDWYLPSIDELYEMYNTIGNGDSEGDIGGFSNSLYWSSSENLYWNAWFVNLNFGDTYFYPKNYPGRVRVIRAF